MADDFGFGFDPAWSDFNFDWAFPDFNFDWSFPDFNWSMPDFNWAMPDFGMGFDPAMGQDWSAMFGDPLALPTLHDFTLSPLGGQQADFSAFGIPEAGFQGLGGGQPMQLADLGYGGSGAPNMGMPGLGLAPGGDPMVNLMGEQPGFGMDPAQGGDLESMFSTGAPLPGGSPYGIPGSPMPGLGGAGYPGMAPGAPGAAAPAQPGAPGAAPAKGNTWDTIAKLAAAFGPTALGAAGLGMQAANRPKRNPLEDELIRARIDSQGLQDSLARERLAFEREQAAAMLEAQQAMQSQLIASRAPGGPENFQALLAGSPQLQALYSSLTKSAEGLASGNMSPEFQAIIDQVAQTDIAELQRQAQQQKAQAMEMATRQGVNPANIIAEIDQRLLQEIAKARANARTVLLQMLQPGLNLFNMAGSLFGGLAQSPAFPG